MKSLWNDAEATLLGESALQLRVYSSTLIGREENLVLHGGGNTSVKITEKNFFGDPEDILYVKGSGWDLATIQPHGFAPVRMSVLKRMATLEKLSDSDMVREQKAAMTNPGAPAPSVEAILHALIPYRFVDHTHADAVVALTNSVGDIKKLKKIFGPRVLFIPYIMPGFILARKVYEITQGVSWDDFDGIILMNHGIFTYADSAKSSYELMIHYVTKAEEYLDSQGAFKAIAKTQPTSLSETDLLFLAQLRHVVSRRKGAPLLASLDQAPKAVGFSALKNIPKIATQGPLTPDHVIYTKRIPVILSQQPEADIAQFSEAYLAYFKRHNPGHLTCLDTAPRWGIWPGRGVIAFGASAKQLQLVADISRHTMEVIQWGEALGGWHALSEKEIFDVEYWELEQAKIKKIATAPSFQGKVALVTGAASGIGRACVESLTSQGAAVVALDINSHVETMFKNINVLGKVCDVTNSVSIKSAITETIIRFGGLDILISNAGTFPTTCFLGKITDEEWNKSLNINLSSHQKMLQTCIPFLRLGIDPAVVIIGSKNVPAPGPGAAAYSVAKAGLTQLARVAALELGTFGIRVNVIHPNAVFDTAIWTEEVLQSRAQSYGISVEEYKKKNILGVEVTSQDVAHMACAMAGPLFAKTTAAQIPIDGGNERVI